VTSLTGITYRRKEAFRWNIPVEVSTKIFSHADMDEICESCETLKNIVIKKLEAENKKFKKLIAFLRSEIESLELNTATTEKALPLKEIVKEFTSTPEGKKAWDDAWQEQHNEWKSLVESDKISRIKYYRLINGMDQATLAKKLNTAQPNISRIEKPGYNIPVNTLEKLAKIFKVKKGALIGD